LRRRYNYNVKISTVRARTLGLCGLAFVSSLTSACDEDARPKVAKGWEDIVWNPTAGDAGRFLNVGEACTDEGAQLECGKVTETHDDYVTCSMGYQTCTDGFWGECQGTRITQKEVVNTSSGVRPLALGSNATCPAGFDPCDPYCNQVIDVPGGFVAGPNLSNTPSGVTPLPTGVGNCTALQLTPSVTSLTVSSLSPMTVTPNPVTFTLTATPNGCATVTPFATTWAVDKLDRATMGSSTAFSNGGKMTLAAPIAGTLKVTAFAHGLNQSTNIEVKVNALDSVILAATATSLGIPSTLVTTGANATPFGTSAAPAPGTVASTASWLYPYANTYLPLGLPAPTIQYRYTAGTGKSVKVSLRYPVGSTAGAAGTATFNYSIIVKETNAVAQTTGIVADTTQPQIVIPQAAWRQFEQAARGNDAEIIIQRYQASVELETKRTIHFVDGQLKGTVYYNSYSSPQGGDTGAVMAIAPGATTPTIAVQPSGNSTSKKCTVCHSINLDGTRLITNGYRFGGSSYMNQSRRYDLTKPQVPPYPASPLVLNDYNVVSTDTENVSGDRYTFGAAWLDGTVYLTHAGDSTSGDRNWRASPATSGFYRPANSAAVTVTDWPTGISAISPRFSPLGNKIAFGYWGATGTKLKCSPNTAASTQCITESSTRVLAPAANGTRLVVADFAYPASSASATGWAVSNARDVTPGITEKVAWPSFTPDGTGVLYQRQYRTSRSLTHGGVLNGGWSPSDINTVAGALAEIWMSKVPADGTTTVVPTRLTKLNGENLPDRAAPRYRMSHYGTSQTVSSGSPGPAVIYSGAHTLGPYDLRIDIVTGGALGTATFRYSMVSILGTPVWSATMPTADSVYLDNGMNVEFAAGTYNANSIYKGLVGAVAITGTPTGGPWDVVVDIENTTGVRGTAKYRYSTNGGSTWSALATTAASAALGTTGLTATFANTTYESTDWYYRATPWFSITQADNCGNLGEATGVFDYRLNYLPAVAPTDVGGYSWVVFTSRRMYGNIADDDPWEAEPNESCNSGELPTKKLWVAAVDKTWTPGNDPSHPAFYLPGQELEAGNSNGYWVNAQCGAVGASCETDDDCCGGTGDDQTHQCGVVSTATVPPTRKCQAYSSCSAAGEDCTTGADCCTGLSCPTGGGECVSLPSPVYAVQTFEREYTSSCPHGTNVAWRFFEWQATIPTGTSISFKVQTRETTSDTFTPAVPLAMATASASTPSGSWERGAQTAGAVLSSAGYTPGKLLKVTMSFNPNSPANTLAPTLLNWRQIFDCVPGQ
jgi:hypothetical protein